MSTHSLVKPAHLAPSRLAPHPFEASVRKELTELRAQLNQLKNSGTLDAFGKSQAKNLEAQLSKKNAYLASLSPPSIERPAAPGAVTRPDTHVASTKRPGAKSHAPSKLGPPEHSFGALGARLKGRLAQGSSLQLSPGAPPKDESF